MKKPKRMVAFTATCDTYTSCRYVGVYDNTIIALNTAGIANSYQCRHSDHSLVYVRGKYEIGEGELVVLEKTDIKVPGIMLDDRYYYYRIISGDE